MGLSTTETVMLWAAKTAFEKSLGRFGPAIANYHSHHFKLLYQAGKIWSRDRDLQKTITEIKSNLDNMRDEGNRLLRQIPDKPKPPAYGGDWDNFERASMDFLAGAKRVRGLLTPHIRKTEDLIKRSKRDLNALEKKLKEQSEKASSLRQVSILSRLQDVQYVKLTSLGKLQRHANAARSKFNDYNNI
ncbi:MAG: hypothetical protein AAFX62_14775 [Pseudomonadota bacterium]